MTSAPVIHLCFLTRRKKRKKKLDGHLTLTPWICDSNYARNTHQHQILSETRPNWPRLVCKVIRALKGQGVSLQGPRGSKGRPTGSQGVRGRVA